MGLFSNLFGGKNRRASVMNDAIHKLVDSGGKTAILEHVYYEAAFKFALESGAKYDGRYDNGNSIGFIMNVNGTNYNIYLARQSDGSTYLGIDNADELTKQFRERINRTR